MHGGAVGMSRKEFFEYLSSFSMLTFGIKEFRAKVVEK
jgi:hypothetical protein